LHQTAEEKVARLELVKDFRWLRNLQLCSAQKATNYLTFRQNQRSRKDWSSLVGPKEGKKLSYIQNRRLLVNAAGNKDFCCCERFATDERDHEHHKLIGVIHALCLLLIRATCSHAGQRAELTATFQRTVAIGRRMLELILVKSLATFSLGWNSNVN
jgi:hypothetical protein